MPPASGGRVTGLPAARTSLNRWLLGVLLGRDLTDTLYYGENLEILSRFISDATVDLVYLDPPFSRNVSYSAIFRDESDSSSDAQLRSFEETWHWGPTPARHYDYLTNSALHEGRVPAALSDLVASFRTALQPTPLLAYLVEMATRLVELHRVLKPTGSLYLHCDPTASHYLKLLLDSIFGARNFVNEIIWKRQTSHNDAAQGAKHFGRIHDVLLFYAKGPEYRWKQPYRPYDEDYIARSYQHIEPGTGRRYTLSDLTAPGGAEPRKRNPFYEFLGISRYWRFSVERMEQLHAEGRIVQTRPGAVPRQKRYLDEMPGMPVGTVWDDIKPIPAQSAERIGFPTQKPLSLLRRIIEASSLPGGVVLDPYCGCGTAIEAAIPLGRRVIGIDHSISARKVILERMAKAGVPIGVFDWPTELAGVREMAESKPDGRQRFEEWALARLGAQRETGRGADKGVDGRIRFTGKGGRLETVLVSIKSGHVGPSTVRDLVGTIHRERAAIGLLFTLQEPTEAMRREAHEASTYRSPIDGREYPRIALHTVRELVEEGRMPDLPSRLATQDELWSLPTLSPVVRETRISRQPSRHSHSRRTKGPDAPVPESAAAASELRRGIAGQAAGEGDAERRAVPKSRGPVPPVQGRR